jgi:hypothetical protein
MLLLGAVVVAVAVAFALAVVVASREHCCLSPCEGRALRDASNRKLH